MKTYHKVIFGNCMSMEEISDQCIHLMVTSPPYFNSLFDYRSIPQNIRELSIIDKKKFQQNKWYMTLWEKLKGRLSSNDGINKSTIFFNKNSLNIKQKELIKMFFAESRENNFLILIEEV